MERSTLYRYAKIALILITLSLLFVPSAVQAAEDKTPPQITAFSLSPPEINTESQSQEVNVTVTITDDQAGVDSRQVGRFFPVTQTQFIFFELHRVSGTSLNGIYTGTATFPMLSQPGAWMFSFGALSDGIGNSQNWFTGDLEALFGPGSATITNNATVCDSTPPEITAFSISPGEVNTDDQGQEVTVSATLTDDQAGVAVAGDGGGDGYGYTQIMLRPSVGTQELSMMLSRVSGDDSSGIYSGTATLPKGSQPGAWSVGLALWDKVNNVRSVSKDELEALFGPGSATVTNNGTDSDSTPPEITAFSISPGEINTDNQSQEVTITATITDDKSGARTPSGYLVPLIGTQIVYYRLDRVSGTALNGTYTGTATLPMGSKQGIWGVGNLFLHDMPGNFRHVGADELSTLSPDGEGTIANTAEAQSVTIERDWTITSDQASVTFPEGTVVTKKEGGVFAFYKLKTHDFSLVELPTTDLSGTPVAALKLGIPGLNLLFSKPVSITFYVDSKYDGYTLLLQSLAEGGDAWANEKTVPVTNGTVTFTVNHATHFLANTVKSKPVGTIRINRNDRVTTSNDVSLRLSATDKYSGVKYMRFSNNGKKWMGWLGYSKRFKNWNITHKRFGNNKRKGRRYVYVQFKNRAGSVSKKFKDSIIYR